MNHLKSYKIFESAASVIKEVENFLGDYIDKKYPYTIETKSESYGRCLVIEIERMNLDRYSIEDLKNFYMYEFLPHMEDGYGFIVAESRHYFMYTEEEKSTMRYRDKDMENGLYIKYVDSKNVLEG